MSLKTFISKSAHQTEKIAFDLAGSIRKSSIIALFGNLGFGKTTFAQGFAKGLKIKDKIKSPTFSILKKYEIPGKKMSFFHIDLYRVKDYQDLKTLGFEEIIFKNSIVLIEWADKIKEQLPKETIFIKFEFLSHEKRKISIFKNAS